MITCGYRWLRWPLLHECRSYRRHSGGHDCTCGATIWQGQGGAPAQHPRERFGCEVQESFPEYTPRSGEPVMAGAITMGRLVIDIPPSPPPWDVPKWGWELGLVKR